MKVFIISISILIGYVIVANVVITAGKKALNNIEKKQTD